MRAVEEVLRTVWVPGNQSGIGRQTELWQRVCILELQTQPCDEEWVVVLAVLLTINCSDANWTERPQSTHPQDRSWDLWLPSGIICV